MGYGYPLTASTRFETLGAGTGVGTSVTANASANTKGSYATIGTAGFSYDGFYLSIVHAIANASRGRVDIAVNTGGADTVILADIVLGGTNNAQGIHGLYVPVKIPSGAAIKARWQATVGSRVCEVTIVGFQGDARLIKGCRGAISLTDFTNSDPTNTLTLSGTTQTGWTQICASSAGRISGIIATLTDVGTALGTATHGILDIGWGGAGSETVLCRWPVSLISAAPIQQLGPIPCDFPAGTRFAFRAQAAAADTNVIGMALNGLIP